MPKKITIFIILMTLFTLAYFFTDTPGTYYSEYKGIFYVPLLIISIIPGFIAFMVHCIRSELSGDIFFCTFIPEWITYFTVSLIISSLPLIGSYLEFRRTKK